MNEISLNLDASNGMENTIGLYYAAEKYDIQDIRDIAYKFMMENCNEANTYLLFKAARAFNLSNLEATCMSFFMEHTYLVLSHHLGLDVNDEVTSEFMALEGLSLLHEYELYLTLEVMVQSGKLSNYSKCLSQIRFLTMESKEIMKCDLLSVEEQCGVIANIEVLKHHEEPIVPMPSHLSSETKSRVGHAFQ